MAFRALIESKLCTVQDFELAATERFWEGLSLLLAGRDAGGVYLMGYVAEMLLKNACFRLDPTTRPSTPVDGRLAPAKKWMKRRHPKVESESYHSLEFWLSYLRAQRFIFGKPAFDADFERNLIRSVRRIYLIWSVESRYRPDRPSPREAQTVYDAVVWIRDHYPLFWR